MNFIVYKHTNRIDGKAYIGWTKFSMEERWDGHVKTAMRGGPWLFHSAIREHGVDAWSHEILETHSRPDDAKRAEIRLIVEHRTRALDHPELGYNMTRGGEGMTGFRHSESSKMKMSLARYGPGSIEHNRKISESSKGKHNHKGENHPQASFSDAQVIVIRRQFYVEGLTRRQLQELYQVSKNVIGGIVTGTTWQHLPICR